MTYRRCIDAQRAMDARPGSEPHPPQITDEEGEENRPDQRPGRGGLPRTAKPERVGVDSAKPGCPEPKLPKRDPAKAAKKMEVIYGELFGERTGELSKLIESHDMEVGRLLALEKLRADKRVSAGQFQMFEKLAMGVPVADVCSQLGLSANQVYITRNRVLPIYEDALAAAKAELDEPTILPKSPVV
jgi:hypothetical protein